MMKILFVIDKYKIYVLQENIFLQNNRKFIF